MTKPLCYKTLTEIADACLSCDLTLVCFPMDEHTKKMMGYVEAEILK
jgi:hypothetical protein